MGPYQDISLFLRLFILHSRESEQIRRQYTLVEIINYTFSRLRDPKNVETQGDMLFSGHTRYLFSMVCVVI